MHSPFKILFLHGKAENGESFQRRLSSLEAALKAYNPQVQCVFATAPHEIGKNKYAWWQLPPNQRSYTTPEYIGIDETLEMISNMWTQSGPYDAVIAHSQGSILASVCLAKALQTDYPFRPPKSVLYGAAWPKPFEAELDSLSSYDYSTSSYVPATLHIYAMNDDINPPQMAIQIKDLLGPLSQGYEHDQGHDIPQHEASLKKLCSFLFD